MSNPTFKKCSRCGDVEPISNFSVARQGRSGPIYRGPCKRCASKMAIAWTDANIDRARDTHLRRQYGITLNDYEVLLSAQGGVCAICGNPPYIPEAERPRRQGRPTRAILAVDHDHDTGHVRGLLCIPCNRGIGFLKDSPKILRSAFEYLGG